MADSRPVTPQALREAYRKLTDRVGEAAVRSGRSAHDVLLVAVTKYATPDQIRLLVEAGHRDFAENRPQQLTQRVAMLNEFLARRRWLGPVVDVPGLGEERPAATAPTTGKRSRSSAGAPDADLGQHLGVRWHMIGRLQRNKVKLVVPLVRLIHSIDNLRIAEELDAFGARSERVIDVLLQVNVSGETTKAGITAPAVGHLAEQINSMINLRLRGLMTIAPYSSDPEDSRTVFARTAELFYELRSNGMGGHGVNVLSMGMSHDYEVAVSEGANVLRVGTALFGEPAAVPIEDRDEGDDRGREPSDTLPEEQDPIAEIEAENRRARER